MEKSWSGPVAQALQRHSGKFGKRVDGLLVTGVSPPLAPTESPAVSRDAAPAERQAAALVTLMDDAVRPAA